MKKQKQMYRCMEDRKYRNGKTTRCPTKTLGHDRRCGFTLVELVIVIAIVIILSVISVPIYRGYVDKSKMAEGYALLGSILSAQKAYYSEYGHFYCHPNDNQNNYFVVYDTTLGIDARSNKYFTCFKTWNCKDSTVGPKVRFDTATRKPKDLTENGKKWIMLWYNITSGATFEDYTGY